jgi:spore coat protein U-like protein
MNTQKHLRKIMLLAILGATSGLTFAAGTASATIQVSATIGDSCSISAQPLSFGTYDQLQSAPTDASTTISVKCSNNVPASISLDNGNGGASSTRAMKYGVSDLNYALFSDAARTQNWGIGSEQLIVTGTGLSALDEKILTVYGRVPANQNSIGAGVYLDTITATISY